MHVNPDHGSQLALIRALRELGATHVRVGDVECRFDLVLSPLASRSLEDNLTAESEETRLVRRMRNLEKELGISPT